MLDNWHFSCPDTQLLSYARYLELHGLMRASLSHIKSNADSRKTRNITFAVSSLPRARVGVRPPRPLARGRRGGEPRGVYYCRYRHALIEHGRHIDISWWRTRKSDIALRAGRFSPWFAQISAIKRDFVSANEWVINSLQSWQLRWQRKIKGRKITSLGRYLLGGPAAYRERFFGKYSSSSELCFGSTDRPIGWAMKHLLKVNTRKLFL